jgi:pseudaminic acid synthase
MKKTTPFIIAEISANHNGSLKQLKRLIDNAKEHGANAVKIQTYNEKSMTINLDKNYFKIKEGLWKNFTYWDLYKKAKTPYSWHKEIFSYAKKKKILCFSTPFDSKAVEILEKLNCPMYKIASFEITDIPLIKRVAKTKKPMIISTGLSNLKEISLAYQTAKKHGAKDVTLLYCVSSYPAPIENFNLNNILILKNKFKCRVGFSDHSKDNTVAIAASALGADVFEKHIALKNQKKGFDIDFSVKGKELRDYIEAIKKTKILLGSPNFVRKKSEIKNIKFRRSLYVSKSIKKGEKFTEHNLRSLRPKIGLDPIYIFKFLGKKSKKALPYGLPITKELLKKII